MSGAARPRTVLAPLTSLRFFAALLVFLTHCTATRQIAVVFALGNVGVAFFFLLSGFILTYTYAGSFEGHVAKAAVGRFYLARFARVYPVYLVTLVVMLAFRALWGGPLWSEFDSAAHAAAVAAEVLVVQTWFPTGVNLAQINPPDWTIAVEALFYALFPVLAWGASRLLRGASVARVLFVAAVLWIAIVALEYPQQLSINDAGWYRFPPARLPEFITGVLLGTAYLRRPPVVRTGSWGFYEMLALCGVFLAIVFTPFFPNSLHFGTLVLPFLAAVIVLFAWQRGPFSRALSHPAMVQLGEISFSFYLVHVIVIFLVARAGWSPGVAFVVSFLLAMAASFALFHFVEEPMRARIRALSARQAPALAAA